MTRQKTEFGTQVNPGTTDHRRLNQEFKTYRGGEGGRPHPGLGKMRNPEKRKRQLNIYGKYFPPQAQSSPRRKGAALGGDRGAVAPALPFPRSPTEQVPSKALGTFYDLKTIYLIAFLLKNKISPPI